MYMALLHYMYVTDKIISKKLCVFFILIHFHDAHLLFLTPLFLHKKK